MSAAGDPRQRMIAIARPRGDLPWRPARPNVNMPGMTGLELYRRLPAVGQSIPTVLITAYPDDGARARALNAGVVCYLCKPFAEADLRACICSSLARPRPDNSSP